LLRYLIPETFKRQQQFEPPKIMPIVTEYRRVYGRAIALCSIGTISL
jgi:hypothetical protein